MNINTIKNELKSYTSIEKAKFFPKFFKAGHGEYAQGDKFIGVTVPNCRIVAKKYKDLPLKEIQKLIKSKIHEERLVALLILVENAKLGDEKIKEEIYLFYLKNTKNINNWDLVDLSAPRIVGKYLVEHKDCATTFKGLPFKGVTILKYLAKSKSLWERRIAITSTFTFIYENQFEDTLAISEILLTDKHDLIHKAAGWMLREVGKRNREVEEKFLKKFYKKMPRTMLRYSIEKFPENLRQKYLKGLV